jgi:hypothetical protein
MLTTNDTMAALRSPFVPMTGSPGNEDGCDGRVKNGKTAGKPAR